MSAGDIALIVAAMFAAGCLNAAAGGGSLVSFPALVATGLSPLTANVSNTLALWPGYVGGAASLSSNLRRGVHLRRLCVAAALGAVVGSVGLLVADSGVFEAVVPFLVLLAAALLAIPQRWLAGLRPPATVAVAGSAPSAPSAPSAGSAPSADASAGDGGGGSGAFAGGRRRAALAAVGMGGAYGAYFGGALGVIFLAVLSAFVGGDLRNLNATKNVLSLLVNTVALVAFVGFAPVDWGAVAAGAPASLAGSLAGGAASKRIDPVWLRRAIVAYATVAGVALAVT